MPLQLNTVYIHMQQYLALLFAFKTRGDASIRGKGRKRRDTRQVHRRVPWGQRVGDGIKQRRVGRHHQLIVYLFSFARVVYGSVWARGLAVTGGGVVGPQAGIEVVNQILFSGYRFGVFFFKSTCSAMLQLFVP